MAIANRPARSARRMRVRAGLSLFEVLVAIGILVALAAVSLPWAWSRLAARDLPESAETITALLMLARAEAMSTGRLVEVRVRRGEADASIPTGSPSRRARRRNSTRPSSSPTPTKTHRHRRSARAGRVGGFPRVLDCVRSKRARDASSTWTSSMPRSSLPDPT
jgi:hypothetical protein